MKDILEEIVAFKRSEVERQKKAVPPAALYARVEKLLSDGAAKRSMRLSLAESPSGIIAEFKRKSPSKGWIHADARPEDVIPRYEKGGASALSILTDGEYFGGTEDFVRRVRPEVSLPVLRKDFIIDEYQIFRAKDMGADAVLLIAADLGKDECRRLARRARELELEVLLEIHAEKELDYISDDTDMVGVNNRNLGTFRTDVENSFRLAPELPADKLLVSESGISDPATIRRLRASGFRGFLIGERFMREADPGRALEEFIRAI